MLLLKPETCLNWSLIKLRKTLIRWNVNSIFLAQMVAILSGLLSLVKAVCCNFCFSSMPSVFCPDGSVVSVPKERVDLLVYVSSENCELDNNSYNNLILLSFSALWYIPSLCCLEDCAVTRVCVFVFPKIVHFLFLFSWFHLICCGTVTWHLLQNLHLEN